MAENEVGIRITADASDAVQGLEATQQAAAAATGGFSQLQATVTTVSAAFIAVKEAVDTAREVLQKVYDLAVASTVAWAEQVEQLGYQAQALGVSTEQLDRMNQASYLLTGQTDLVSMAMLRMERSLAMAAATGKGPVVDALSDMGISAEQLLALPMAERINIIVQGLGQLEGTTNFAKDATALFSRSYMQIIPLLAEGGQAWAEANKHADEFGRHLSPEAQAAADSLTASVRELKLQWDKLAEPGWWTGIVQAFVNITSAVVTSLTELKLLATQGPAAARAYAEGLDTALGTTGGHGASGSWGGATGDLALLQAQAAAAAATDSYTNDVAQTAIATALSHQYIEQLNLQLMNAEGAYDTLAHQTTQLADHTGSAADLMAALPALLKKGLKGFGIDTDKIGTGLDTAAGNLNDLSGTSFFTGAGLGGAIGVGLALLMQDPTMKAEMAKLQAAVMQLVAPIAQAIAPALDALVPILHELKPVFQIIADVLKVELSPLVAELKATSDVLSELSKSFKDLTDALSELSKLFKDLTGALNSSTFFGFGVSGNGVQTPVGNFGVSGYGKPKWHSDPNIQHVGYAEGGVVTPDRMLSLDSMGAGLIFAHAGETVVPRDGTASQITLNVHSVDARQSGEQIRRVLEELVKSRRFGL